LLHILISRCKIMVREVHHHLLVDSLNHIKTVLSSLINGVRIPRVDPDHIRILWVHVKLKVHPLVLIDNLNARYVNIRVVLDCLQIRLLFHLGIDAALGHRSFLSLCASIIELLTHIGNCFVCVISLDLLLLLALASVLLVLHGC
jgi:hypothetical protein